MFNFSCKNIAKEIVVIGCALALGSAATASTFEATCDMASKIDANGSTWRAGYNETETFNVDVATGGILVLDVSTGSAEHGARIIFLGRGCAELGSAEDFVAVEQGAAYQVIAIRAPGTYSLRVMSAGIGRLLGDYEFRSSFTPVEIIEEEAIIELGGRRILAQQTHLLAGRSAFKSDLEIVNPNPDGVISVDPFKSDLEIVNPNPDGVISVDPFKSDLEIVNPNPDGVISVDPFKSDLEIVNPNPDGFVAGSDLNPIVSLVTMISQHSGTVIAELTLFPDENSSESEWFFDLLEDGSFR